MKLMIIRKVLESSIFGNDGLVLVMMFELPKLRKKWRITNGNFNNNLLLLRNYLAFIEQAANSSVGLSFS